MKTFKMKRVFSIALILAMLVSFFAVSAFAASYTTTVSANATVAAASIYLSQSTYTVKCTNSDAFNCTVWFQKGSNIVGTKVLYYTNSEDYCKQWQPWISTAGTYKYYISNNGNATDTYYTSVTKRTS